MVKRGLLRLHLEFESLLFQLVDLLALLPQLVLQLSKLFTIRSSLTEVASAGLCTLLVLLGLPLQGRDHTRVLKLLFLGFISLII